jgi:hypothetical protein
VSRSAVQSVLAALVIAAVTSSPSAITASRSESAPPRGRSSGSAADRRPVVNIENAYLRTPLRFEPATTNGFTARGIGYAVTLAAGSATLRLRTADAGTAMLEMRLVGGRADARASTSHPLTGPSHHLIGNNRTLWRTGVQSYGEVRYHEVYPGIDLAYYGNQRQLEYDFIVNPGASPDLIAFEIEGARAVRVDGDGNLRIETDAGTLTHRAPVVFQELDGRRRQVAGRYVVRSDREVSFEIGEYDSRHTLVIDPVLDYATYLGGSNQERLHAVAIDAAGNIVVAGETYSPDFPTASAPQPQNGGFGDAFVAKLTPAGDALVFATYLGGVQGDSATGVEVDASGAIYLTGTTFSWNFPTLNGVQPNNNGQSDAFVVKLDVAGNLLYSTLLGGMLEEYATGIAVDAFGRAHITGSTMSPDFPLASPVQPSLGGSPVFKTDNGGETWSGLGNGLRSNGVRAFAIDPASPDTVYAAGELGGVFKSTDGGATWLPAGAEIAYWQVNALAVASGSSAVYAATQAGIYRSTDGGTTWSFVLSGWGTAIAVSNESPSTIYVGLGGNGFPVGVFKSVDGDSWIDTGLMEPVSALAVSGSRLYAATWPGVFTSVSGGGWVPANAGLPSQPSALVADASNPAVAYAATFEGLFKTTTNGAAWDVVPVLAGVPIASVAISTSEPSTLMVSVLWGGTGISNDGGENWRLTHSEAAVFFAMAFSPSTPAVAYLGGMLSRDAFVATIGADGNTLEFSSYFGGSGHERATDIAVDSDGARYIVGETGSSDLPLSQALQSSFGGLQDAFAARIAPEGLTYSTYLGGSGFEATPKLALDASRHAHVAGLTWSADFPTANPVQAQPAGGYNDLFVSVLTPNGAFRYSTYLGGEGSETDWSQTIGPDVSVNAAGDTYITGTTMSLSFPTTPDAFQPAHGGGSNDAFLMRLDAAGRPQYSTYLGGTGDDYGRAVMAGGAGEIAVAGYTTSADFPTRNALQPVTAGSDEAFIARIADESGPSDTEAPVTAIALDGTSGQAGWYRSAVTVTLTAADNEGGTGVAAIQYRINGGALQTYTAPFTVASNGTSYLTVQATDRAGNVEAPAPSTVIKVDTTAPAIGLASPQPIEYLYNRTVNVSVAASDSLSGLAGPVALTIDGVPFTGSTLDMATLPIGPHTLSAAVSDIAGNSSQASVTFRVVAELDTVINVPEEMPTIQAAIDAADNGFTVLVAPGTYLEAIDFRGKAIAVVGQAGAALTIIDARGTASAVTFKSGETRSAVLRGFTVRGGFHQSSGGGVYIANSSPTIADNIITANVACSGVGVYSSFGSPRIERNRITGNTVSGCGGAWGIGVYVLGNSAAEILENEITNNTGSTATGGGLALFAAGNAVVRGNLIANNSTSGPTGCGWGGGIASANFTQAKIVNNRITGNAACTGGGIYWLGSTGNALFVNNTVADNEADSWPGMFASFFDSRNQLHNNIIAARRGPAFYCQNAAGTSQPVMISNDVFSGQGAAYGGTCIDQTGSNGNVSADPLFLDATAGDYRVSMTSPVVDGGHDAAPALPATDLAGQARVVDGNADGIARVDIGALEYRNRAPVADAGADRTVSAGADCLGRIALTATASDADNDPLTFTWSGAATGSGPSLALTLPIGTHVVTLTVDDGNGGTATDSVVVTVVDTTAPTITSVTATPAVIEKANHDMIPVAVSVSAEDGCGAVDCRILTVTSNEAGDNDWEITGKLTLRVRAERAGKGDGRVYTITVTCKDEAGNVALSTVTVTVPR